MEYSILFTDLDDTLLRHDKSISEYTRDVLFRLLNSGKILVLSSGRPFPGIVNNLKDIGLPSKNVYICAYNGGFIYDCLSQKALLRHSVGISDAEYLMRESLKRGIYCQTYSDTHIIAAYDSEELLFYQRQITQQMPFCVHAKPWEALCGDPFKVLSISLSDRAKLEDFGHKMSETFSGRLEAVFSNNYFLEFIPSMSGKGAALKFLCDYLNIPVERSIAIGDNGNDVSMIESAGLGAAVANAADIAKNAADIVSNGDNNHDGVAEIVQKYML